MRLTWLGRQPVKSAVRRLFRRRRKARRCFGGLLLGTRPAYLPARRPGGIGTSDAVLLWRKSLWWIFTLISAGGLVGVPSTVCRIGGTIGDGKLMIGLRLLNRLDRRPQVRPVVERDLVIISHRQVQSSASPRQSMRPAYSRRIVGIRGVCNASGSARRPTPGLSFTHAITNLVFSLCIRLYQQVGDGFPKLVRVINIRALFASVGKRQDHDVGIKRSRVSD
jgi:hypothetical protein